MKQPLVLIAAEGGLCNRLRVLLSAVAFSPRLSQPLRLAWGVNAECAASFSDLFLPLCRAIPAGSETMANDPAADLHSGQKESVASVFLLSPPPAEDCLPPATEGGWQVEQPLSADITEDDATWTLLHSLQKADFQILPATFATTPATRHNLYLPWLWRSFSFDKQIKNYHPDRHPPFLDLAQRHPRLYLSTCYALGDYPPALLRHLLRPLPHLQERIDGLVRQFSAETIGVHIRRTDNAQSIAHSPTEKFVAAMDAHPAATFYLATDDEALKSHLRHRYGSRLIAQTTTARRDTLSGMEEALVDLFALSRTHRLLGSYWSSFTDTAAELGGIPVEIVR